MRNARFEVPTEVIGDFVEKLIEVELNNTIVGITDDGDIEIEVHYEKDETGDVDQLEYLLEKLIENIEEEEE